MAIVDPICPDCESSDIYECESPHFGTTIIKCSNCGKSNKIVWMRYVLESDFDDVE